MKRIQFTRLTKRRLNSRKTGTYKSSKNKKSMRGGKQEDRYDELLALVTKTLEIKTK